MSSLAARFLPPPAPPPLGFLGPPPPLLCLAPAFPVEAEGGCSVAGVGGWLNLSLIPPLFGSVALAGVAAVGVGCWPAAASGEEAVLSLRVGILAPRWRESVNARGSAWVGPELRDDV